MIKSRNYEHIDINTINQLIEQNPEELVASSEAAYQNQIRALTKELALGQEKPKIILLSGPSGSTKTTTAKKLSDEFLKYGEKAEVISLDDFFVNREALPILPNGDTDFESIQTVDMDTLHRCLDELERKQTSEFPIFDFEKGRRSEKKRHISLSSDGMLIIEGIHAINPLVTSAISKNSYKSLYVSPHSDYICGDEVLLSARDLRFIRRLVRDYYYRANPVSSTLKMWENVVASELLNIIPYRDAADYKINSTIHYEPCIFEYYLTDVLSKCDRVENEKLSRVTQALRQFKKLPRKLVPQSTVLYEFIK